MLRRFALPLGVTALLAACGGESGPTQPGNDRVMRARVNGTLWELTAGAARNSQNTVSISGVVPGQGLTGIVLVVYNVTGPGHYPFRLEPTGAGGFATVNTGTTIYLADLTLENPGGVTFTSIGGGRTTGTFSFIAKREGGSETRTVTDGEFDLPLDTQAAEVQ